MSSRRQRFRRVEPGSEDETVGLAGWMYTDLLLGLAVVFLGSIGFVLAGRDAVAGDDRDAVAGDYEESSASQSTVSTSSTSTTSTLPPEECTILYAPAEKSKDGFYISRLDARNSVDLKNKFQEDLEELRERETRALADEGSFIPPFEFNALQIGIAIASGGGATTNEGNSRARETVQILKTLFPDQLGQPAVRTQWSTSRRTREVDMEVVPTSTGDCAILRGINS